MKSDNLVIIYFLLLILFPSCTNKGNSNENIVDCDTVFLHKYKSVKLDSAVLNSQLPLVNQVSLVDTCLYIAPTDSKKMLVMNLSNNEIIQINIPIEVESFYMDDSVFWGLSYPQIFFKYNIDENVFDYIHLPDSLDPVNHLSFFVADSVLYCFSNIRGDCKIVNTFDLSNGKTGGWGNLTTKYDDTKFRFKSSRHILNHEESIYTIGHFIPIIEKFSKNGQKEASLNLNSLHIVNDHFQERFLLRGRTPYILIADCCIDGGFIYLLLADGTGADSGRHVLTINLNKGLVFCTLYELVDSKKISNFSVHGDSLVAYDIATSELHFYKIE